MGVTVTLATALAVCREIRGDGSDWLDYYLKRMRADRKATYSFMTLPDKLANQRIEEIIDYFGSCEALLNYEEQNGLKAFNDVVVPDLSRRICEGSGRC